MLEGDYFSKNSNVKSGNNNIEILSAVRETCKKAMDKVNGIVDLSEEEKNALEEKTLAKLKSGKKLSVKELNYLRVNNPILYMKAVRIQKNAEAVEARLKNARSKEEAARIISDAMSMISEKDPDRDYLIASVNRISKDFYASKQYKSLPATDNDAKKRKITDRELFKNDEDEEDYYLKKWTPLNEVLESLPSFETRG
ncbi:MAG: hypothetical protein K6B75_00300 [Lachnospiraceae bacterium]|nr:hypothetical protein [Lachnospiraceae bacterium]